MARIVLPLLFVTVGLALAGVAGWLYVDRRELVEVGDQVTGTVTSIRSSTDSESDTTYAPAYTYTYRGEQRQHTPGSMSSSTPDVGDRAVLFVDPSDPGRVMADTFMERWFVPVLLGAMGIVFFVVGSIVALAGVGLSRATGGSARAERRSDRRAQRQAELDRRTTTPDPAPSTTDDDAGPFVSGSSDRSGGPFL